mgnify:CR=1 FL=1
MNEDILEQNYRERLEERIIARIAEQNKIPLEKAMDVYYHSRLAEKIYHGINGIQYLDYKVLVDILHDTEPVLFESAESFA